MKYGWFFKHLKAYPFNLKYKLRIAKKPDFCTFAVTHKCNSRCRTCNFWKNKNEKELTLQEINKLFKDDLMRGLKTVSLTGGEALLREDLAPIINLIYDTTGAKIDLGTNGFLPKKLDSLLIKTKNKLAGVQLSVDGLNEVHNKQRGVKNAFKLLLESIKLIEKHNLKPGLNMTLSPWNYWQLYETYKYFQKYPFTFKTIQKTPYYFGDNLKLDQTFNTNMKISILKQIKQIGKDALNPYTIFLDDWLIKEKRPFPCYAGITMIYVDAVGNIYPCTHKKFFGNIREESLKKIWLSAVAKNFRQNHKTCSCCYERCSVDTFRIDAIKWAIKCKMKKRQLLHSEN